MSTIVKRTVGLTQNMWDHIKEDCEDRYPPRSASFQIREIIGKFFKLPKEEWHEVREPKPARRRIGRGRA